MTKAIARTYDIAAEYRMQFAYALIGACALTILVYGFNVYSLITRTVALQKTESKTALLGTQVASLDAQYLELSSTITPDALAAHGLAQADVSEFISRGASPDSVAMNGHEF